jgi:hypothetical protein
MHKDACKSWEKWKTKFYYDVLYQFKLHLDPKLSPYLVLKLQWSSAYGGTEDKWIYILV